MISHRQHTQTASPVCSSSASECEQLVEGDKIEIAGYKWNIQKTVLQYENEYVLLHDLYA